MIYDLIKEKLKTLKQDERLVITDKKKEKVVVAFYYKDENELWCYINSISKKNISRVEQIWFLEPYEIDDVDIDVMTHKIWFEYMRDKNARHFYERCTHNEKSWERRYFNLAKEDVGKYITIQGKYGRLIGLSVNDEDCYWMLLDNEDNKIKLSSCLGEYKILEDQNKYYVHDFSLVKEKLEQFMSFKYDIVDVVIYSELDQVK